MNLSDVVLAIGSVAGVPELPARPFNIATGRAKAARDMVRLLIDVSGVDTERIEAASSTKST